MYPLDYSHSVHYFFITAVILSISWQVVHVVLPMASSTPLYCILLNKYNLILYTQGNFDLDSAKGGRQVSSVQPFAADGKKISKSASLKIKFTKVIIKKKKYIYIYIYI